MLHLVEFGLQNRVRHLLLNLELLSHFLKKILHLSLTAKTFVSKHLVLLSHLNYYAFGLHTPGLPLALKVVLKVGWLNLTWSELSL